VSTAETGADLTGVRRPYLDGKFTGTGPLLPVRDPATGEPVAEVATNTAAEIEQAVRAARRAFDDGPWPRLAVAERVAILSAMSDHLDLRREELVEQTIAETGCPRAVTALGQVGIPLALSRQLPALLATLPEWEHNEMPLDDYVPGPGRLRMSIRKYVPVGVVSAITAYNFPLMLNVVKVFPALAAGCTVVLRPSPLTPLSSVALAEAAAAAGLPAGVLNVVIEEGVEGSVALTTHPAVDLVSFTGSTAVGRRIAIQAGDTVKRLILELGGKSVQLYLADALAEGPGRAVAGAAAVFANHAGQACVAQTRMLVPRAYEEQVLAAVSACAERLIIGDPRDPGTQVGPLISAEQRDRCARHVRDSLDAGGRLVTGGGIPTGPTGGWYFQPTVISVRDNDNPACREEIFGPVLTVQGYDDLDQAIDIANDSDYGLSGAIHTDDYALGLALADRIRAGNVHINTGCATAYTPSGGMKRSGVGRERGIAGLRAFQEIKHVVVGNA
jgi:aldehyde dehydrogenase (NAD+)